MRVIHYIPSIDRTLGGTTTYMQLLANELGKLVELHIVTHKSRNPVEINNCQIHYISSAIYNGMKREWQLLLNLIHSDIVHMNCCWLPGCVFAQKWAQELGYKVVLTPHGMLEPWIIKRHYWTRKLPALLLYQKKAIVKADYLHATAEREKENLLKLHYNDRIEVIGNGIEVDDITMKSSWQRRKEILFLSRVHIKKGINFLIEAVSVLKRELEGYTIHIAGEGDENYINELRNQVSKLGLTESIQFIGGVYGEKKWELIRNADVFVLPTHSENFGIVVTEALACGTPVITTKGTPWEELITYNCGWWTEIGKMSLVEALKAFLQLSIEEVEMMGRNGRRLVQEKYSMQIIAKEMVKLYEKINFKPK